MVTGCSEGGTFRHWAAAGRLQRRTARVWQALKRARGDESAALCAGVEGRAQQPSAGSCSDSKGIVPISPAGNSESLPSTDYMGIT